MLYEQCCDALQQRLQYFIKKAAAAHDGASAARQECSNTCDLMGEIYLDSNDIINAKKAFEKSIELLPDSGYSKYMNLGQVYATAGSASLQNSKNAVQMFKRGIEIMRRLKQKLLQQHQQEQHRELTVMIGNGCCSIAELYMTDLCFEPNAEQECSNAMEIAMSEDATQSNMQVLQTLASLRLSQCRPDEARRCMMRVMELYTAAANSSAASGSSASSGASSLEYDFQVSTAKILMELGLFADAEQLLHSIANQYELIADVWYLMGVACQNQHDYSTAVEHYTHAVKLARRQGDDPRYIAEIEQELANANKRLAEQQAANGAGAGASAMLLKQQEEGGEDAEQWEDIGSDDESDDEDELVVPELLNKRNADEMDDIDF